MKSVYTGYEIKQLTNVFGNFPQQEILIFGETDRIFIAAHELIKHFGGLLNVNISSSRAKVNLYEGVKIEIYKQRHNQKDNVDPDYWLVDHIFIREFFSKGIEANFDKFRLDPFLPTA